jgi:FeS assembly SUF system protein
MNALPYRDLTAASPAKFACGMSRDAAAPTIDDIVAALRTVFDPEIPVNVFDLGLIYRIDASDDGAVEIDMTLTAPGCPVAGTMLDMVKTAVSRLGAVTSVRVDLVFEPPWDKSRMSEETQLELGLL